MKQMRMVYLTVVMIVITMFVNSGLAESIDIDYDSLTLSELEQIVQDANEAIAKNHEVDSSVKSYLESKTKVSVPQMIENLQGEPSWRWFDWTYRRDWEKITVITEVKIDGEWLPLEAEYIESNGDYILNQLVVDGKTILEDTNGNTEGESQRDISITEGVIAQIGDKNSKVKEIQSMLIKLGYAKGKPNGNFDEKTEKVVKKFQKKNGLEETGIVTESVYALLVDACSKIPEKEVPKSVERLSADQLQKDYDDNEVSADLKYKGKEIEVTGQVASVDKSWGTIYVDIEVDWLRSIRCAMKSNEAEKVAALRSGQNVIIRGTCTGTTLTVVYLDKCTIVN